MSIRLIDLLFPIVFYYSGLRSQTSFNNQKMKLKSALKNKLKYFVVKNRLPVIEDFNNLHLKVSVSYQSLFRTLTES